MDTNVLLDFEDEWFGIENVPPSKEVITPSLDLTTWKRCRVLTITKCEKNVMLVTLEEKNSKLTASCRLLSPWNTIEHLKPGLIVSVIAVKERNGSETFEVNSNEGFFVTDPDFLVSGTTVVGSLFCQRKGVLQELYRISDTENQQMHIGTIAHSIFQQCLVDKTCKSLEDIKNIADELFESSKMVFSMYGFKMSKNEALRLLNPYLIQIDAFLHKYVHYRSMQTGVGETNEMYISKVNDIEENIWCHHLGIKGKIDATVSVRSENVRNCEVMPLELKTGRASFSFEHKGQLALYEMMMNLVGHRVNAGLLLYLGEGKCTKMIANRNMKRDLIMLRNEIARFFSQWMVQNENILLNTEEPMPMLPTLPTPINNARACVKCPYKTVCVALYQREPRRGNDNVGFGSIAENACEHLRNGDIDYFIRWSGLIYLEQQEFNKAQTTRKLWTKTPEKRAEKGWCLAGLTLVGPVTVVNGAYSHTFMAKKHPSSLNGVPIDTGFHVGDYVICSTNKRIAVAAGYIMNWIDTMIVVNMERNLTVNHAGETFHLDQSSNYSSTGFNLSNLAMLVAQTEEATRIRRIIIDREKPTFSDKIRSYETLTGVQNILGKLNYHQKDSILKAAATESFCLLKGLPGTGKTQTIVSLIRLLSLLKKSVLLTSNTHSAVDNVLQRLLQYDDVKFIRLGSLERIDPAIQPFSDAVLRQGCDTTEDLEKLYDKFQIVAVTCQGTGHALINQRLFDYCIVDEATQVFQPTIIRPLLRSSRFLLVGDPEQLPPVVKSAEARSLGATESLFHRLDQEGSCCILPTQYRMNRALTELANRFAYDGKLICGTDLVASATLKLPYLQCLCESYVVEKWLIKTLSIKLDQSAVILDTGSTYERNLHHRKLHTLTVHNAEQDKSTDDSLLGCTNVSEVALILYICRALLQAGINSGAIGIIAPFRAQVDLIRKYMKLFLFNKNNLCPPLQQQAHLSETHAMGEDCIEINTVDQFQGKDKKLIIYSCTKSLNPAEAMATGGAGHTQRNDKEILSDKRRLTVAITRAQEKLIVIGDRSSLCTYAPFYKLFKISDETSNVHILDEKDGFSWESPIQLLSSIS
ncbi:DNA replication ATP-dependent helicase/nuclease DNA2 [Anopheles nili]|uniref:DNA replication ATP-dependent helicase/nuclease DNA2 n=1 Tax=Anopheles nili TaxID=185578 RepID=UPI00237AE185|nr:DNA replication ATP-dependent helicase/nuclease DNA2 [Anopheles nili]